MNNQKVTKAKEYLKSDEKLIPLIELYELEDINQTQDLFNDIVESIISQQLSVKASDKIYKKFCSLFTKNKPTPFEILAVTKEQMREVGVSTQKVNYIKGIANAVVHNEIDFSKVQGLPDEEVIIELTKLKGVGRWTAEMILIFSLGRDDIFSVGDLGLRTAVAKVYGVSRDDTATISELSGKWAPHRSTASRLLWKSLDNVSKK